MKNNDAKSVHNAMLEMFKTMGYPMSIYSDGDAAFKGVVKAFLSGEGITHITTLTHANVVERWIRKLKNGIYDRERFTKSKWEDLVDFVVFF